tara:strand:+ start:208 stop:480 length:273 start_codon:yes stop_codon:yes gene_type:complete
MAAKKKYYVLLVQHEQNEPFVIEWGDHNKKEVKDELEVVRRCKTIDESFNHHILTVPSDRQIAIDIEVECFNRGRGYETTCHRGLVKSVK